MRKLLISAAFACAATLFASPAYADPVASCENGWLYISDGGNSDYLRIDDRLVGCDDQTDVLKYRVWIDGYGYGSWVTYSYNPYWERVFYGTRWRAPVRIVVRDRRNDRGGYADRGPHRDRPHASGYGPSRNSGNGYSPNPNAGRRDAYTARRRDPVYDYGPNGQRRYSGNRGFNYSYGNRGGSNRGSGWNDGRDDNRSGFRGRHDNGRSVTTVRQQVRQNGSGEVTRYERRHTRQQRPSFDGRRDGWNRGDRGQRSHPQRQRPQRNERRGR